ncbi:hypothetical protein pipiens_016654 [Culex pipiens pipiens]|uniref:Uncharacterized protein n=1 Tax=Culex pipiens pipiens TaxID=38569 RepID=A0ABD1CKC1_CULPP
MVPFPPVCCVPLSNGTKVDKQLVSTLVSSTILWTEMLAMAKTEIMRSDICESKAAYCLRYRARNQGRKLEMIGMCTHQGFVPKLVPLIATIMTCLMNLEMPCYELPADNLFKHIVFL